MVHQRSRAARRRVDIARRAAARSPAAGADGGRAPRRASFISVYRHDNAGYLESLFRCRHGVALDVALWALDRVHPRLERFTVGVGPGGKFDLLNQVLARQPAPPEQPILVVDDDVVISAGSLRRLLDIVDLAGFGIAQPAHRSYSFWSHPVTRRRPLSVARLTTYVEIGPMFVVTPAWRDAVLPFPADLGLGWGLELEWMALREDGCRLGVVDAVSIVHCAPVGGSYDGQDEMERFRDRLRRVGFDASGDIETEIKPLLARIFTDEQVWRPWRRRPPWTAPR